MPTALWLIILPVIAAPLAYLFRRQSLGGILAAVVAASLVWLTRQLSPGHIINIFGRAIYLNQFSQATLLLLFSASTSLFLIPALSPEKKQHSKRKRHKQNQHGGVQGQEGRTLYPIGLIILAIFVMASFAHHLGIIAIFVEFAAILTVFIIQGGRLASTRAALRFLSLMSLATPLFIMAAWQMDFYILHKNIETASMLTQMAFVSGMGFALWLAIMPFHGGITVVATDCYPSSAAFVLIAFPLMAFATLINLLLQFSDLSTVSSFTEAMLMAGGVTAVMAGGLASLQRGFSELLGYAALYDIGCDLVMLATGEPTAILVILVSLTTRTLALILLAASTSAIRSRYTSDGFAHLKGTAMKMPVATAGLFIGGLTLAGAPFTAGFAPRLALFTAIQTDMLWLSLLALAGLGVAVGYLRGLYAMLTERLDKPKILSTFDGLQEPFWLLLVISLCLVTSLIWGIFPTLLIDPLQKLTAGLLLPM